MSLRRDTRLTAEFAVWADMPDALPACDYCDHRYERLSRSVRPGKNGGARFVATRHCFGCGAGTVLSRRVTIVPGSVYVRLGEPHTQTHNPRRRAVPGSV